MSFPGAAPPPPGIEPDLDNPKDVLRTCNYVTQAITLVFVTVFIAIRVYAKKKFLSGVVSPDDYAAYTSYVLMIGYCITCCCIGAHGGGLNQWEVRKDEIQPFFKSAYAATLFYAPMALTVKLALILIIMQVFGEVHTKTRIGLYIFIGMLVLYYGSGFFIKMFICKPISAYWRGEKDKCLDQSAIITADAIISVVSDLVILLLPTPLTWSLQLPVRKRLRVIGLLCAGGIATAFSIYRLALILKDGNSANQTIVFTKVILSGNAEAGIGLICACLPSASALIVRRNKGSSYYAQQSHSTHGGLGQGEIRMTRSYHIDVEGDSKQTGNNVFEMNSDQAGLVSDAQADPRSNLSSRRSGSTR